MSLRDDVFALLDSGTPTAEIINKLEITPLQVANYKKLWREKTGDPSIHHPEKAGQVDRLAEWFRETGDAPLEIYETCGGLGLTAEMGYMHHAWSKVGRVVSRIKQDGDMVVVSAREIQSGRTYDVVDADVYGGVWRMLDTGLPEWSERHRVNLANLVRPKGMLICTWPTSSVQMLNKDALERLYGHRSIPTLTDFLSYMARAVAHAGRQHLRGGPAAEKYGSIWRIPMVIL